LLGGAAPTVSVGSFESAHHRAAFYCAKRRGVGLRACEPEPASPGFTLFAPHFVQNRSVYLIDLQGEVVHTWNVPYPPGLSGYLTERGTLFYNERTSEENFLNRFPGSK
jgi:hypothetical protein